MDLRRGTRRVCRKPEPHLHALPRRAAEDGRPAGGVVAAAGPQHQLPGGGVVARCDQASLPGIGGTDQDTRKWLTAWEGKDDELGIKGPPYRQLGVDAKWEHCIVVADADGNIIETWTQWDKLLRRPHSVYISPYDPEKHVWVVDDNMQVDLQVHQRRQEARADDRHAGTAGADATHFNRPTFIDWLPDGTFFVSDGYTGTRVAKFDKDGKFLMDWGIKGTAQRVASRLHEQRARRGGRSATAASSSTIATTIACRCSTRTASSSTPGDRRGPVEPHLLYIGADGTSGPSIAARTSS